MRTVKILFYCHLAALFFGLAGLLVMLPHPELWDTSPTLTQVFNFGIHYAGSLHILFGAATMLLFGLLFVGPRRTLIFFAAATTISLSMELLGTSTGFPFGAYSYTSFLGIKVLNHVPYSIPLSWFYMGFTSFILASIIVARWRKSHHTAWSLALGVYFLTVWDLALDPAMASQNLPLHFWIWQASGPYFGMPISNLVGWSVTGLIFMGVSRLFWRSNLHTRSVPVWLPFGVYTANIGFAIALNLSVGLWIPPVMAVTLGLVPASLALFSRATQGGSPAAVRSDLLTRRLSLLIVRAGSWALARRKIEVVVEGLECVPRSGPTLIVARHFHHFYDGCALLKFVPRRLHILVALDWVQKRWLRTAMEWACGLSGWPTILRAERLNHSARSVYAPAEASRYLRRAVRGAVQLLRGGELLVVFPEAYPNIDPAFTPKDSCDAFLPFRPGFARLVELAEKDGRAHVAIVPAGLTYIQKENGRWHITLRFGPALSGADFADSAQLAQAIEQRVHYLSHAQKIDSPLPTGLPLFNERAGGKTYM